MTQVPHQVNQPTPDRLTIVAWADPVPKSMATGPAVLTGSP